MLGQNWLLLADMEEMDAAILHFRRPGFHELQHFRLPQRGQAARSLLEYQRAGRKSRADDLLDILRFWLRAMGAMERGVWEMADLAVKCLLCHEGYFRKSDVVTEYRCSSSISGKYQQRWRRIGRPLSWLEHW